jgi:hypothetical protein
VPCVRRTRPVRTDPISYHITHGVIMWVHMFRIKKHSRHIENFVATVYHRSIQGAYLICPTRWVGFERSVNKFGIDRKATKLVCADILFGLSLSVVEWFQEHFLQHSRVRCVAPCGDPCIGLLLDFISCSITKISALGGRDRYFRHRWQQQSHRARSPKSLPFQTVLLSRQRHIPMPRLRPWVCG